MRTLAIDCSAKSVSVALAQDGNLIAEGFLNIKLTHSETLMPLCEQVLSNAKLTLSDIDNFAVSAGPGSFTGIRIGISLVKGLAFSEKKPVTSFSTLEAMALQLMSFPIKNCIICGLMDARRNQFYNAVFKLEDGKISRLCEDRAISYEDLKDQLLTEYKKETVLLMGDGAKLFFNNEKLPQNIHLAPETFIIQRANGMAVQTSLGNISPLTPETLQPVYLRLSQAERERDNKINNA